MFVVETIPAWCVCATESWNPRDPTSSPSRSSASISTMRVLKSRKNLGFQLRLETARLGKLLWPKKSPYIYNEIYWNIINEDHPNIPEWWWHTRASQCIRCFDCQGDHLTNYSSFIAYSLGLCEKRCTSRINDEHWINMDSGNKWYPGSLPFGLPRNFNRKVAMRIKGSNQT